MYTMSPREEAACVVMPMVRSVGLGGEGEGGVKRYSWSGVYLNVPVGGGGLAGGGVDGGGGGEGGYLRRRRGGGGCW